MYPHGVDLKLTPYQEARADLLEALRELAAENLLELINSPPTRRQGLNRPSILDIALTNRPDQIQSLTLLPSSTDHQALVIEKVIKLHIKTPGPRKMRSFKDYSKQRMNEALNPQMLESLIGSTDTNLVANVMVMHITQAIDKIAPVKLIQPRAQYAPYLTVETKVQIKLRDSMRLKANVTGKEEDFKAYKKMKNRTLRTQRKDKLNWATKLIGEEQGSSKNMWKTVQTIAGTKKGDPIEKLVLNGRVTKNKLEIAEGLNQYFIDKVKNLIAKMPEPQNNLAQQLKQEQPSNIPKLELYQLTMPQLLQLMKGVKRTPASGIDGISGLILHDIFETIKIPLLHLINLSLCTGTYPEVFKLTKIIPVEKVGKDPLQPSSFRPVCNLSVVGKLVERAAMNQVENHINTHRLMNKDQHGGRGKHSTMTCLGEIMEDAKLALEDKQRVALVACDLSAAYDLCSHSILEIMCKNLLNMDEGMVSWLSSFLKNRSQLVEVCGERSKILPTGSQGVVQGGPSSGLLFNIYINSMPAQVNNQTLALNTSQSTSKQYVDDGTIIARGRNLAELKLNIEADFAAVRNYLVDHRMVINPEKTQLMVLHQKQTHTF